MTQKYTTQKPHIFRKIKKKTNKSEFPSSFH